MGPYAAMIDGFLNKALKAVWDENIQLIGILSVILWFIIICG